MTSRGRFTALAGALLLAALPLSTSGFAADDETDQKIDELDKRLTKVETQSAIDRIRWGGDLRFELHSYGADFAPSIDGVALQKDIVDTAFYFQQTGMPPIPGENGSTPSEVMNNYIYGDPANFVAYQKYLSTLNFNDLKSFLGQFSPEQQKQLMGLLLSDPSLQRKGFDYNNDLLYTTRLRLEMRAKVADTVDFYGRLAMYKVWGDSTAAQVFNGQPNSINLDGTTVGVPNSDIVRVERAYFDWKDIGGIPLYLSIGRRPSTEGAPLHLRQDEPRGGTPLGTLVNYQFDGITVGYHISDYSTVRLCYGVGYEAGFGNGQPFLNPGNLLDDAQFIGINWDILNTDRMFIQATVARAIDVTDGFNGTVVLPFDPLSGNTVPAPVYIRYTPSANLGNIDLASVVFMRHDGRVEYFLSGNYMKSDPTDVTTPFGGLFSGPYETPESQSGTMWYGGVRYTFPDDKTKIGVEYNHGSQYWFNFAAAEDDIILPKTEVRGDVLEGYVTYRIYKKFIAKLDYMHYDFKYSGSGWNLGTPENLDDNPITALPTYKDVSMISLSMIARF